MQRNVELPFCFSSIYIGKVPRCTSLYSQNAKLFPVCIDVCIFSSLLVLPNPIKCFMCILPVFNIGKFLLIIYLVIDFVSTVFEYLSFQMFLRNLYNLQFEYLLFHFSLILFCLQSFSSPHAANTPVDNLVSLNIPQFCFSTVSA